MSQLAASDGQPGNWEEPDFSPRLLEPVRVQTYGWQEPCESRDSRTVLWERGGEIPLRDPTVDSYPARKLLLDTLNYSEAKISRPREVKETPWLDCVLIIIDSMMGRLTGLSECHSTIKLAPEPPLLSLSGMT